MECMENASGTSPSVRNWAPCVGLLSDSRFERDKGEAEVKIGSKAAKKRWGERKGTDDRG